VRPDNPNLIAAGQLGAFASPHGLAVMNAEVGQQAAMVAYADDFKLMMLVALGAIPLLLLMKAPKSAPAAGEVHAVE
jgi:DHA2 family multidrug resistance protein